MQVEGGRRGRRGRGVSARKWVSERRRGGGVGIESPLIFL